MSGTKQRSIEFDYDEASDVVTIEGIHYSGDIFRMFGKAMPLETPFKIIERTPDGVLAVMQMEPHDIDWRGGLKDPEAGEVIQTPLMGEVRVATEEQRCLIADLAAAVPITVFQELNKRLNLRGFMLTIQSVEELIPVMGMAMPPDTKAN